MNESFYPAKLCQGMFPYVQTQKNESRQNRVVEGRAAVRGICQLGFLTIVQEILEHFFDTQRSAKGTLYGKPICGPYTGLAMAKSVGFSHP